MKMKTAAIVILSICVVCSKADAQIDFTNWHDPASLISELENLATTHPTISKIFAIGTTHYGLPIKALKISDNVNYDDPNEGDVIFVGLHHAREWISAEMCLYLAEYLVNALSSGSDPELTSCMNNLEIWVIPVLNPDGYSHTVSDYRFWRKNRRNNGDGTYGVDLNRNYSYMWGFGSGSEGSDTTIDNTYRGPFAFSEPETQALRDFIQSLDNPKALLTYHSFSELFLRPWAYTTADPPGEKTLKYISDDTIARIAAMHGHTYSDSIWYNCYGETCDYFWSEMRLAAFTPELRPNSGGLNGFDPPPSDIIPNNEENLPAAIALIKDAGCRKVWIKDYVGDTGVEPSAVWTGKHWTHAFWQSPDIWTVPTELVEGSTVTLYVRVHNDTGAMMAGCNIAAFYTDPRLILEFPALDSVLIGEQTIDLPTGDTTISFPWTVPTGTNIWGERHWCVGAIVYHSDDRPLTTQVQRTSNIGCKNFETVEATFTAYGVMLKVAVNNFLKIQSEYRIFVDLETLPPGWEIILPKPRPEFLSRKARLLGVRDNVLKPGEVRTHRLRLKVPRDVKPGTVHDIQVHAALLPLVPGKRIPIGNGYTFRVRIPEERK